MFKEYRIRKGYTLEELASILNISWRNLFRIENGHYRNTRFETIAKMIYVLDINVPDIIDLLSEFEFEIKKI